MSKTLLLLSLWVSTAQASSFIHRNLKTLTDQNELVVIGQVSKTEGFWSDGMILTAITFHPTQVLKGNLEEGDFQITMMGGTVGETTALVVDGGQMNPGSEYLLFLNHEDLPGAPHKLTIPDHIQGIFNLNSGQATSQAAGHKLIPDSLGEEEVPGGNVGLPLEEMKRNVLEYQKVGGKI